MRRPGRWPPAAPCRALRTGCLPGGRLSGTGILWPAAGAPPSKTLACSVRWYLNAIISTFIPFVLSQASPLEFVKIQIPLEGVTCLALAVIYILLYVRVSALPSERLGQGWGGGTGWGACWPEGGGFEPVTGFDHHSARDQYLRVRLGTDSPISEPHSLTDKNSMNWGGEPQCSRASPEF